MKFQNNDPSTKQLLLKPVLDYIKNIGKDISCLSISHYSPEDDCDIYLGIEGKTIDDSKTIDLDEIGKVLILNVAYPENYQKNDVQAH